MVKEEKRAAFDTIVETYGIEPQVDMAIEECSELIKALLKYRRVQMGWMKETLIWMFIWQIWRMEMKLKCIGFSSKGNAYALEA